MRIDAVEDLGSYLIFDTGLYELVPGLIISFIAIVAVSPLTGGAGREVEEEYEGYEKELKSLERPRITGSSEWRTVPVPP